VLSPVENPEVSCSDDAVPAKISRALVASQIQAYHAAAELTRNLPSIPDACRRCRHGGDLHLQRLKSARMLASGLLTGLSTLIHLSIKAFGGKVALMDGLEAEITPQNSWQVVTRE
jgi:hypothetical protein